MKTPILCCLIFCLIVAARADVTGDDGRLATLKALAFTKATSASIAKIGAPKGDELSNFHGCILRSRWKKLSASSRDELGALLRNPIDEEIIRISKTSPGEEVLTHMDPMGFGYGDYGVRLETDAGVREFSICLAHGGDGYIYVYDLKKHGLGVNPSHEVILKLENFDPSK
ncbi:MAG TPA: hypothetical protein VFB27_09095 [Opitutaceae bacterium]|nr:hypothetical protein [Opitutaceae bacterium]